MTPVAVKNWLMEEHRSAIWAASSDQLLSSACRMLSFRPDGQAEEVTMSCDSHSLQGCNQITPGNNCSPNVSGMSTDFPNKQLESR